MSLIRYGQALIKNTNNRSTSPPSTRLCEVRRIICNCSMRLPNPSPCSGQATATILLNRIVAVQECDLAPLKLREGAAQVKFNRSDKAGIIKKLFQSILIRQSVIIFVIRSFKFLLQARLSFSCLRREEGKSGQHRAMHR